MEVMTKRGVVSLPEFHLPSLVVSHPSAVTGRLTATKDYYTKLPHPTSIGAPIFMGPTTDRHLAKLKTRLTDLNHRGDSAHSYTIICAIIMIIIRCGKDHCDTQNVNGGRR